MLKIGVVGYGYWGPNIVRNFNAIEDVKVVSVCDKKQDLQKKLNKIYPDIQFCTESSEITSSKEIDVVAVVSPVSTHYQIAKDALLNGKHVFVEKPFTATVAQAEELIELGTRKNLQIMVDHTFLFTPAVRKIKRILEEKTLGELYYFDSTRINLGLFQHDVNVVWDLAPHDFSIMDFLLEKKPLSVTASGKAHFNGKENIAYIVVNFDNIIAHFNVNWLSPVKVRNTIIGGEKKMLIWNDVDPDEKLKIYDKGVDVKSKEGIYELLVSYRSGDIWSPKLDQTEALKFETEYFIECIHKNQTPFNDGHAGLRVVRLLQACDESLKQGKMVTL